MTIPHGCFAILKAVMRPYMSCLPTDWFEQDKCGVQVNLKTKVEFPGLLC